MSAILAPAVIETLGRPEVKMTGADVRAVLRRQTHLAPVRKREQESLIRARKFVLDVELTELCAEVSTMVPSQLLGVLLDARVPFDELWVEWPEEARITLLAKGNLTKLAGPETPDVVGVHIRRLPDSTTYLYTVHIDNPDESGGVTLVPFGGLFDFDDPTALLRRFGSLEQRARTMIRHMIRKTDHGLREVGWRGPGLRTRHFATGIGYTAPYLYSKEPPVDGADQTDWALLVSKGNGESKEVRAADERAAVDRIGAMCVPTLDNWFGRVLISDLDGRPKERGFEWEDDATVVDKWAEAAGENNGDFRFIATVMAMLSSTTSVRYDGEVERVRYRPGRIEPRHLPFMEYRTLKLSVPRERVVRDIRFAADRAASPRRAHEVMGHWCETRRAAAARCDHVWMADGAKGADRTRRQVCLWCDAKRWWRWPHTRGDATLGFVHKDYEATASKGR